MNLAMNNFNKLPDECLVHIMEHCDDVGLLRLSETCKRFDGILSATPKLMRKIKLRIRSNGHTQIKEGLESLSSLIEKRPFKNFCLLHLARKNLDENLVTNEVLNRLSETVEDVTCHVQMLEKYCERFLKIFVPKVKVFRSRYSFKHSKVVGKKVKNYFAETDDFPMKELDIFGMSDEHGAALKYFMPCKKLEKLQIYTRYFNKDAITEFLKQQRNLKHLKVCADDRLPWNEMPFQLNFLEMDMSRGTNLSETFIDLISSQQSLMEVNLVFTKVPTRNFMEAICSLHKLKKFVIRSDYSWKLNQQEQTAMSALNGLQNYIVEEIETNKSELTRTLFQIFKDAKQIKIDRSYDVDLSDVPHEKLSKIVLETKYKYSRPGYPSEYTMMFRYSPANPSLNAIQRERDVLQFFLRYEKFVRYMVIGSESWLTQNISMSDNFYAEIIQNYPKLERLEIFNAPASGFLDSLTLPANSKLGLVLYRNQEQQDGNPPKRRKIEVKMSDF
jgi:hypothetical protein